MRFLEFDDLPTKGINHSRQHIYRLIRAGRFPRPVKGLGFRGRNLWPEAEIDAHVQAKIDERHAA